jgi:excisionase family DNA binding protein
VSHGAVLYTIDQVKTMTGLSRSTLYREMLSGRLEFVTVRRCRRVPKASLDRYVQAMLRDMRHRAAGVSR